MKTILIAPDSFKGSLSSQEICTIIGKIFAKSRAIKVIQQPIADGGEGSLDVLLKQSNLDRNICKAVDPLFRPIESWYLFDFENKTAYIELAKTAGLTLLKKEEQNCMHTTTLGTGMQIKDAIENGAEKIVLFIGGSATNDAGTGIAQALGFRFYDSSGRELLPIGRNLIHMKKICQKNSILKNKQIQFSIACDVNNPLSGKNGAAYVYAKQKGALPEEIEHLDEGLNNFANIVQTYSNKTVSSISGAGAAGGVGAGGYALLNAQLISGTSIIFEASGICNKLSKADVLITGEGKIDSQSINEKLIFRLIKEANKYDVQIYAICGFFDGDFELQRKLGIDKVFSFAKTPDEIPKAIKNAKFYVEKIAAKILREL